MKKIILVTIIILLNSCTHLQDSRLYKRTIKNESGVPIKIYSYSGEKFNEMMTSYTLDLKNGDSVYKEREVYRPFTYGLSFSDDFFGGSVPIRIKIIYDNKKVTYFKSRKGDDYLKERNIIGARHNDGELEKTFTFTKQDYLDAEDCNGDCK